MKYNCITFSNNFQNRNFNITNKKSNPKINNTIKNKEARKKF